MKIEFYAYETYCLIEIMTDLEQEEKQLLAACRDIALQVETVFNMYDDSSELSQLCRNYIPGRCCPVSELLYYFLKLNLEMAVMSDGDFDPTVGALVKQWGIGSGRAEILKGDIKKRLLESTGYQHIQLCQTSLGVVFDREGVILDPGASGKGFAIDRVVDFLRKNGVNCGYLNFGGNLYLLEKTGKDTRATPWKIGIRHPERDKEILAVVETSNCSVSTSSGYEHYFERDGERYCHLLDPHTGKPAGSKLKSVTILSPCAAYADMLSTALYVMESERGIKLIEEAGRRIGKSISYLILKENGEICSNV